MNVLAHPFRVGGDGSLATVRADTAAESAQLLATLLLTERGERPLVPAFGITDPTFGNVDPAELAGQAELFGPQVTVEDVELEWHGEHEAHVTVTWT